MLLGRPVIGAQSGATSEIVKEGFNGLLYIPGDPKSLADKIRTLYEDPELATRMGANGKKWAELIFTEERYARELCGLLTSLKRPVRLLSQSNCQ
jgi:glycosyltransferase involved in cell wall biosynthesis